MYVIKRSGNKETVQFDKITNRLQKLNISSSIDPLIVTQKICSRIFSGITTTELDNLASQVCMNMVMEHPDYGVLGSRIIISNHQKNTPESFYDVVFELSQNKDVHNILAPLVSQELIDITQKYKDELQDMIVMDRDYLLDYFGFKTLERSYLLKLNGKKKRIFERPQHLFLRVAIGIHGDDLESIRETYNSMSLKLYTHATPTLFNAGTNHSQLSSCFLISTEDSVEGIFETISDCAKISKWSGGIGVHISNIRCKGSYIRKTAGTTDGIIPMLKVYNDVSRYINQSGKRNGSFAIYLEPHHGDVYEFLEAKKNTGPDELRARDLFYALWVSDYFMECIEKNDDWYLMDPDNSYGLTDVYGDEYKNLYLKYVGEGRYVKKVKARNLWEHIIGSQIEHGMPYISYKDHVNRKNNQQNIGIIKSSNLCNEINEVSNSEETAVCNLSSMCLPQYLEYPREGNLVWESLLSVEESLTYIYLSKGKLTLLTIKDCSYCKLLKSLLDETGLVYEEIDDADAEEFGRFETYPQLFSEYSGNGIHIGGYTDCWEILKPRMNYDKLMKYAYNLTINLNKVIDKNFYPTEKCSKSNFRHRPIGLGVQGLADVFMILKLPFTSEEAKEINKNIFESIYYGSMSSSIDLASKYGPYETYKGSPLSFGKFQFNLWDVSEDTLSGKWDWSSLREKLLLHGSRNSLNIALMPTASTSSIFGNNESFEAITSNLYTRNVLSGVFTIINKYLVKDLINLDLWNQDIIDRLIYDKGSVQNMKRLPKFLREIYKTSFEIDQKLLIKMSAERGIFVCQSQSLNLFFDKPSFKELTSCHFSGWKNGLKTGSYYIRTKPALSVQNYGLDVNKEKIFKLEDEQNTENDEGCLNCGA